MSRPRRTDRPPADPASTQINRARAVLSLLCLALLGGIGLLLRQWLEQWPMTWLGVLAVLVSVLAIALVGAMSPRRYWAPAVVYLVVFGLFHFGMVAAYSVGQPIDRLSGEYWTAWFYTDEAKFAVILSSFGLITCAIGALVALTIGPRRDTGLASHDEASTISIPFVGFVVLLGSVLLWLTTVIGAGGTSLLFGTYAQLLEKTSSSATPLVYYGVGLGVAFLVADAKPVRRVHAAGAFVFAAWAVIALPLGLRGEVLFPAAVALVLIARQRRLLRPTYALLLAVALLSLIALLRDVRQVGLAGVSAGSLAANPLDAVIEMGSSLRPVAEVVYWTRSGEPLLEGQGYWAPVERLQYRLLRLGDPPPPAESDDRLSNVVTRRRVGTIGFSVIAEAYRNFGFVGVLLVMGLIGLLLGRVDVWAPAPVQHAMIGIWLVPLFNHIRNDFVPIPSQILFGVLLLCLVRFAQSILKERGVRARHRLSGTPLRSHAG